MPIYFFLNQYKKNKLQMFKKKYQQTTKKENLDTENLSNDIFLSQIKAKSKLKNQLARCFRQRSRIYDVFCFAKKA